MLLVYQLDLEKSLCISVADNARCVNRAEATGRMSGSIRSYETWVGIHPKLWDVSPDPSEAMRRESGSIRSYETWVGIHQKLWDVSRDLLEAMRRESGCIRSYVTCVGINQKLCDVCRDLSEAVWNVNRDLQLVWCSRCTESGATPVECFNYVVIEVSTTGIAVEWPCWFFCACLLLKNGKAF